MAEGSIIGGPVGACRFNALMCKGAVRMPKGLLHLDPHAATRGWVILTVIGFTSAARMYAYTLWLERTPAGE